MKKTDGRARKICVSWVDGTDLRLFAGRSKRHGTLIATLESGVRPDELHLLVDRGTKCFEFAERFAEHVREKYCRGAKVVLHETAVRGGGLGGIFAAVTGAISKIEAAVGGAAEWNFLMGSGSRQAMACWVLVARTRVRAVLTMTTQDRRSGEFETVSYNDPAGFGTEEFGELMKAADAKLLEDWMEIPEYGSIVHKSAVMRELLRRAHRIAAHDVPVLILGESGTGKELFANAIHKSSARASKPMKSINCGALSETTVDATLFGWSKGAWTDSVGEGQGLFMECNGGTVFLDEIGDMSPAVQTKLLRVLQHGEVQRVGDARVSRVNVRIIGATNRDLRKLIAEGKFREDLFFRLDVGVLKLPPLRERDGDAALIAAFFLDNINESCCIADESYIPKKLTRAALKFINEYRWPGNIRELYNTIRKICMWNDGERIEPDDVMCNISEPAKVQGDAEPGKCSGISLDTPVDLAKLANDFKRGYILKALDICGGNKTKAAKMLGFRSHQALSHTIAKLGIEGA